MFDDMFRKFPCDFCDLGSLMYSQKETMESWQYAEIFRLDDIDKLRDGIISEVLVFVCNHCGAEVRLTMKEVEKRMRKVLSDRILTMIARGDLPDPGTLRKIDRTLVYCGKCTGYDGKGSCPVKIYEDCKIKRLPNGF
jgi:hypothetical protein